MKKILVVLMTVVVMMALSLTVMAAPGGFVSSPSRNQAPELIFGENESDDCTSELWLTAYADRDLLSEEARRQFENAYTTIVGAADLGDLNGAIINLAEDKGLELSSLAISDIFDLSNSDCDGHNEHGAFTVKVKPEVLENFVCLLHYVNGNWKIVESAHVVEDGTILEFSADDFSPFAIVVGNAYSVDGPASGIDGDDVDSDDGLSPLVSALIGAAAGAALTAGGFLLFNLLRKKKA